MPRIESDVIVLLGGGLNKHGELGSSNYPRLDTAVTLYHDGVATNLAISGGWSGYGVQPERSESELLESLAIDRGIPQEVIKTEEDSRNTAGNAVFTKQQILVPNGWDKLTLVTSDSHMERSLRIFDFVLGDEFEIEGQAAPEDYGPFRVASELYAGFLFDYIVEGVERGDDQAVKDRLFERVPGYDNGITKQQFALNSVIYSVKKLPAIGPLLSSDAA